MILDIFIIIFIFSIYSYGQTKQIIICIDPTPNLATYFGSPHRYINNDQQINVSIKVPRKYKLFFGIVTMERSSDRRTMMMNAWINEIVKKGHDYGFCTENPIEEDVKWIPLKNWMKYPRKYDDNIDRENKRITMAEYFLKNTTADFYVNPCDDVFVDSSRVDELAEKLGRKYDTDNDLVFLGNCLRHNNHLETFLQGGSGYILTRKMAEKFVELSAQWINDTRSYDDLEVNKFLNYLNQTPKDAAAPYMAGFGFPMLDYGDFNFDNLKTCPDFHDDLCGTGVIRIEDVYIVHPNSWRPPVSMWNNFRKMLLDKKHHYGYYSPKVFNVVLCRFD